MPKKVDTDLTMQLRVQLVEPPINYAFCLQRGKGAKAERLDYIEVTSQKTEAIEFDLDVTVRKARNSTEPDFFGPFAQGPSGARFFYLCVGKVIETGDPEWIGRVKVPISGLNWQSIKTAQSADCVLIGKYKASKTDGNPVLASVTLLDGGWIVNRD